MYWFVASTAPGAAAAKHNRSIHIDSRCETIGGFSFSKDIVTNARFSMASDHDWPWQAPFHVQMSHEKTESASTDLISIYLNLSLIRSVILSPVTIKQYSAGSENSEDIPSKASSFRL